MMNIQILAEDVVVFLFLIVFAIDDLLERRIKNKKTGLFFLCVSAMLLVRMGIPDIEYITNTGLCLLFLFLLYFGLRAIGGADLKIVCVLSFLYGPSAVFYALISIVFGFVWKKAFVKNGEDRLLKIPWDGIPVMFFYLYVFTFFEIVVGSIRLVQ